MPATADTIAARATPPGHGGVGIIRVSGPQAASIALAIAGDNLTPRWATLRSLRDRAGDVLDTGLVLWFPAPGSYTGEDSVEFHGHGGPAVLDSVLQRILELGARPARAGEFTERAFLNGRLDLAQAEAVADIIEASETAGARAAQRSLSGEFSARVYELTDELTALRAWIEAALDFPDDDVDFLADSALQQRLLRLGERVTEVRNAAATGRRLVEGVTLVIAGAPNAGKSSLLNRLAGTDAAIVTEIAGTTRDLLREQLRLDGIPVTAIDTAGLRLTDDPIEGEGVRRARAAVADADRVLLVIDAGCAEPPAADLPPEIPVDRIYNKIDLAPDADTSDGFAVSALTGVGIDALRDHLAHALAGPETSHTAYSARRRHIDALDQVADDVAAALTELRSTGAGELAAEQLRRAQQALGTITGTVTTEDLLGEIFSQFCIGK